ncbi:MAG: helix-turn-helix domain-containing protein [Proteobacteria bacterium]|nr:helix-turn-helix domain-containing protein [Pseudomonadota bacterium]
MNCAEGGEGWIRELLSLSAESCRSLREQLGWSPEELARAAGVATLTVITFEREKRRPREETLIAIRRAFRNAARGADLASAFAVSGVRQAAP